MSRLSVVEMVYHQRPNEQPSCVESRFGKFLSSDEQFYLRTQQVEKGWSTLDFGWVDKASMLVIKNILPAYEANPTEEQRDKDQSNVIFVGIVEEWPCERVAIFAKIKPGEGMRLSPENLDRYRLSCPNGRVRCSVNVVPE